LFGENREAMKSLSESLTKNTTLKLFALSSNKIGISCHDILCKLILKNKSISEINLSDNKFTTTGILIDR
jgi:Ran GTPase-activating protein (RanGAP) involved in mRNA processing and transport